MQEKIPVDPIMQRKQKVCLHAQIAGHQSFLIQFAKLVEHMVIELYWENQKLNKLFVLSFPRAK
ncbi:hypothetical protein PARA125_000649 [Parachlamydia sp. AcF125]|nr:hypothetical protein [Parachlamydia sp. AcF125]